MGIENRKSIRRVIGLNAALFDEQQSMLGTCTIRDMSGHGAMLKLSAATSVPDEFILVLSRDGNVRRRCRIVRRTESEIAAQFVAEKPVKPY
jgi:hypothetical protein